MLMFFLFLISIKSSISVVVIITWFFLSIDNKLFILILSNSDKTSSSKIIASSSFISFIISTSANFKLKAALLICPWEPYRVTSFLLTKIFKSSCPIPLFEVFLTISLSLEFFNIFKFFSLFYLCFKITL